MMLRILSAIILLLCASCALDLASPKYHAGPTDLDSQYKIHRELEYFTRDGNGLTADIYVPKGQGPFPAVLLIHGGSWSSGSKLLMAPTAKLLAKSNFVAININYSLLPKYKFPVQLEDCNYALNWIRTHAQEFKINSNEIAAWGYSAGAQLAGLLATSEKASLKAAVVGSGPYDFLMYPNDTTLNRYLDTTFENNPDLFRSASPLYSVSSLTVPMFLYHGSWDEIVDPKHSLKMKDALQKAGVANELYWVRGLGHISLFVLGRFADKAAIRFLRHHLKNY